MPVLAKQTNAGVELNEFTSLNYSAVFCAVALLSGAIGSLPLHLYRAKGETREKATSHKLYKLLHSRPNNFMTAMALREVTAAHVITWGNAYIEKVTNGMGQIVELWPISPDRVRITLVGQELVYEIRVDGKEVYLKRDKLMHLAGLGFDGFQGYSVLTMARESIGLAAAQEVFGSRFFGSGTNPGMVAEHPGKLSPEAHKRLKDSLSSANAGLGKSHRLMLLEEGMKLAKFGVNPNDSQFIESRAFSVTEIARWFNLPPHKLKDLTRSSFNNIEQEQISYVIDSIRPWLVRLEQCYNMQLLTEAEIAAGYYFEHSVEGLLRGDAEARAKFYQAMFMVGAMSPNAILEKENMPPIDGGDERFVPANMVPLSVARKLAEARPNTNKNPTGTGGDPDEYKAFFAEKTVSPSDMKPIFVDAARRVLNREGISVRRAAKKDDAAAQIDDFYQTLPIYIEKQFEPVVATLAAQPEKVSAFAWKYAAESRRLFERASDDEIDALVAARIPVVADQVFNIVCGGLA